MARVVPRQKQDPWTVVLHSDRLNQPLKWRKPKRIFVNSLSDLFHEDVPDAVIDGVVDVMCQADQHTYQILTKRPERMLAYAESRELRALDHVWLGVSCENQATADARIPILLQTPAAVRFISAEPLLGPVDLDGYLGDDLAIAEYEYGSFQYGQGLDWIIAGGESGPGARPMHPDWARSIRDQCRAAGVPFFFKQWGEWDQGLFPTRHGKGGGMKHPALLDGKEFKEWPK